MSRIRWRAALAAAAVSTLSWPSAAGAAGGAWTTSVPVRNQVVSSPTTGGGYPDVGDAPVAGNCGLGSFNSNHSESWVAVMPGTETLVGSSKFFFDRFSTFYNFYNGSYAITGGGASNNIVQGYDCVTTGSQAMPPSWTNTTDPNTDFDSQGRVYQTMLPFNAFWTNLHPNGEITVSFSDDLGAHWTTGNGGQALEQVPNESAFSFHFEDKQFVAVNHFLGSPFQDHVYAVWDLGNSNGNTVQVRTAVSRDRGLTFDKAQTISPPRVDQNRNAFPLPGVGPDGSVYVAWTNISLKTTNEVDFLVTRSSDDGVTFSTPVQAAVGHTVSAGSVGGAPLPNTTFRDGIPNAFAVSPDQPGHLYLAYNDWDGAQYDIFLVQSTDFGATWSRPVKVNDNAAEPTDQFQPAVAAGPGGAVAVAFYDRRLACPSDPSILPADQGRTNFCIDVSVQAYRDAGAGARPVGSNFRATSFTWDPQQPGQSVRGLPQLPCAKHRVPCPLAFIGDYFGLAISSGNIYVLAVSTHYPSSVTADGGGPVFYQQQVLSTIRRTALGI